MITLALLAVACGQNKEDRKVLESEDGLVRITAWETPLAGMSGSYNTILEYEWEGKKYVIRKTDDSANETVMMPMRLYSLGDNLYLLYQLYRESSCEVYLEAAVYKLTADGLQQVDVFDAPDGWANSLYTEVNTLTWDYELNEDSDEYWWIYYFDAENATLYHPVTENDAIIGEFIPYVWDGMSFSQGEGRVTAEELETRYPR